MQLLPPTIATDDDWHLIDVVETGTHDSPQDKPKPTKQHRRTTWLQWFLLCTGLATITCGAVLIGGSFSHNRSELWDIGFPLVMCGQIMFLVGLVLQMDVICAHGKRASDAPTSLKDQKTAVPPPHLMVPHSGGPNHNSEVILTGLKNRLDEIGKQLKQHH